MPPSATTGRTAHSASHAARLRAGGTSTNRCGAATNRSPSRIEPMRSAVSVTHDHSSMPVIAGADRSPNGIPRARANRSDPRDNGCAAKPIPPAAATAAAISPGAIPAWSISESTPKAK